MSPIPYLQLWRSPLWFSKWTEIEGCWMRCIQPTEWSNKMRRDVEPQKGQKAPYCTMTSVTPPWQASLHLFWLPPNLHYTRTPRLGIHSECRCLPNHGTKCNPSCLTHLPFYMAEGQELLVIRYKSPPSKLEKKKINIAHGPYWPSRRTSATRTARSPLGFSSLPSSYQ